MSIRYHYVESQAKTSGVVFITFHLNFLQMNLKKLSFRVRSLENDSRVLFQWDQFWYIC